MKGIQDADVRGKRVFLRVDFNVPINEGKITDINRIKAAVPTIQYLLENDAKIIIGTHLGRPDGKFNAKYSTVPVAKELSKILDRSVDATDFVLDKTITDKVANMHPGDILLLGNLRFHPEEEANDSKFAEELAKYADVYVNDAFAVSHRANASVEAITHFLPSYAGLLVENETTTLDFLLKNPLHPFVLIIGGAKISDKAGILMRLAEKADTVLIGGAVANTFLKARGQDVGKSLIDADMLDMCKDILEKFGSKIKLPTDYVISSTPLEGFKILDIGINTREDYARVISDANCVFWNGNMGYTEDERYCAGTLAIAKALTENQNTTVIAGGDTVGFVDSKEMASGISFISTGGGAAMQFLSGDELPGIKALN